MIKGLMLTPPVVGRISIGRIVERGGKRLPEKDDEFTLTTQVQTRNGWALHPLDGVLRAEQEHARPDPDADPQPPQPSPKTKLRSIPVRLLFNDPALNLRASYTLFDRATARPVCVGDGHLCKRVGRNGVETLPCPGSEQCALALERGCKLFGRFNVRVDHPENHSDAFSTFVLRTTGVNTIRTLLARMQYLQAVSGGLLAFLPLELRLRGKSTTQSHRAPIYYVDLGLRSHLDLGNAMAQAREEMQKAQAAGLDQTALEQAAREGYAQGLLEEIGEDAEAVVQEFYPQAEPGTEGDAQEPWVDSSEAKPQATAALAARLGDRMRRTLGNAPVSPGMSHG